jgi:hypothetical protein
MIVFDLTCPKAHVFEGWFKDSAAFDRQVAAGEVVCPACGSRKVKKALMAPNIATSDDAPSHGAETGGAKTGGSKKAALEMMKAAEVRKALRELRKTVEENFDHVGPAFAEEARKIHYGEADPRNIYGETNDDEAEALVDEGIEISRIPWIQSDDA